MNDNAITNTISKIHSAILIFFFIFSFILISFFIFLQNGIHINTLILPSIKIEKLYIKWNKKLSLSVEEITVTKSDKKEKDTLALSSISSQLKRYNSVTSLIEEVEIKNITINQEDSFNLHYLNNTLHVKGTISSFEFSLYSQLTKNNLSFDISKLSNHNFKLEASGSAYLSLNTGMLHSNIDLNVTDELQLSLFTSLNDRKVEYSAFTYKDVKELSKLAQVTTLDKEITVWFVEYLKKSHATLDNLYGFVEFDNIKDALINVDIRATAYDVNYTFATGFNPIEGKKVDVRFKDAVLLISPKEDSLFYGQKIGKSYVDIDFKPEDVYLRIMLHTLAQANKDIINLLAHYDIALPFTQTKGLIQTDLVLGIKLGETIDVSAKGSFNAKSSQISFGETLFDINNTSVTLNDTLINIKELHVNKDNWIEADVKGQFDASLHTGSLKASVSKLTPTIAENKIHLHPNSPIIVTYNFDPKQDSISLVNNVIQVYDHNLSFNSFHAPFDFDTLSTTLTGINCHYGDFSAFYLSGSINLSTLITHLELDLYQYDRNNIKMNQTILPLHVSYDESISIHLRQKSHLLLNNVATTFEPLYISVDNSILRFNKASINIDNFLSTSGSGKYDFSQSKGTFKLHKIDIEDEEIGSLFRDNKNTTLNLDVIDNRLNVNIPRYALSFNTHQDGWKVNLDDISKFAKNSALMTQYNVTKGKIELASIDTKDVYISGEIDYPYALLKKDKKDVHLYTFKGLLSDSNTILHINDNSTFSINGENLHITTDREVLNLFEILRFIEEHNSEDNTTSNTKIFIDATNCTLEISPDSSILADKLSVVKETTNVHAQLMHKEGGALFEMQNNLFYFFGKNFNDEFVNSFSSIDDINGGTMSFVLKGTPEKFDGAVKIKDTLLKNYRLINNILAFINTIPSLTTFSLPHYDNSGLPVSEAYVGFTLKNKILKFSDISIDSPELDIAGNGTIDLKQRDINIDLELQTDLGTKMSQVPMVGYLIFGEDGRVSTTLKIEGDLDNPKVENGLAKDIVVAPFNIIKRTLTYPFKIYKDVTE